MEIKLTLPALLHFSAAANVLLVAVMAWKRRQAPAGITLFYLFLSILGWTLSTGFEMANPSLDWKIIFAKFEYLFGGCTIILLITFSTQYINRSEWITKKILPFVSAILAINILLVFTNEWHHLIWTGYILLPGPYGLYKYMHGPLFWVYVACIYTSISLLMFLYVHHYFQSKNPSKKQFAYLGLAVFFPSISGIFYLLNILPIPGLDITPISFTFSAVAVGIGFLQNQFTGFIPIEREVLLETLNDAILVFDTKFRLLDSNSAANKLFDWNVSPIGQEAESLLEEWPELVKWARSCPTRPTETLLYDEPIVFINALLSPIKNQTGRSLGYLITIHDITHLKQVEADLRQKSDELEHLSITDDLTGLYNRRFAHRTLQSEIEENSFPLTVALFDLDDFKQVNDNFGHLEGDIVLQKVGKMLFQNLRDSDVAARMGGDEFLVILPLTSAHQALRILERMGEKLAQADPMPIHISAGITTYIPNEQLEDLLKRADNALYKAKAQGKNKIILAEE